MAKTVDGGKSRRTEEEEKTKEIMDQRGGRTGWDGPGGMHLERQKTGVYGEP